MVVDILDKQSTFLRERAFAEKWKVRRDSFATHYQTLLGLRDAQFKLPFPAPHVEDVLLFPAVVVLITLGTDPKQEITE